jgi:hypothetical protein
MEFSNKQSGGTGDESVELKGTELLDQVVTLTGLEDGFVRSRLGDLLDASGHRDAVDRNDLTLDELRNSILQYLMELDAEINAAGDSASSSEEEVGLDFDLAAEPPAGSS